LYLIKYPLEEDVVERCRAVVDDAAQLGAEEVADELELVQVVHRQVFEDLEQR